jgi:hypothetical protein
LVSDDTRIGLDPPDADPVAPPFDDTQDAAKLATGLPPSFPGVNATDTDPFPLVAVPIVGAFGTEVGKTMLFDAPDTLLAPMAFVAAAEHVYVLPFVSEDTTIGLDAPEVLPVVPPSDDTQVAA